MYLNRWIKLLINGYTLIRLLTSCYKYSRQGDPILQDTLFVTDSSYTPSFENFVSGMDLYGDTSFDPNMSSFSFMESPSCHFNTNFPNFVASQDFVLGEPTQSNDTVYPYQASLTQIHSPFESTDFLEPPVLQSNVTQMPPSPLVNSVKAAACLGSGENRNNERIKSRVSNGLCEKETLRHQWTEEEDM